MKTVTIAIPSLHRPDLTARCIQFLQAQTLPSSEWESVVIENEARPDSILPDPLPPNTIRLELPSNEGTTGSINRAVAATRSRYVLLLNNDIELEPDYLEKLVRRLDDEPAIGFVTGKLLRATQRTHLDGTGDAMLMGGGAYRLGNFDPDNGQLDSRMPILSACGAAVLYRRDAFEQCGGLDADFFAYSDDLDLALRVQMLGYSGLYLPDAVAYHIGSATLGASLHPRIVELLTRNQLFVLMKNYPRTVWLRTLPRIVVYQGLWFAYAAKSGNIGAYCRGLWAALRGRHNMRHKHRQLMSIRKISDQQFLRKLSESERQVAAWHFSRPPGLRSTLLNAYFRILGQPKLTEEEKRLPA